MLHVHSSNRVETLAARLGSLLQQPLADTMQPDVIMVQSHGLERWLSLELAETLGVCANVEFPFPVPYLTKVMMANTPGWNESTAALLDRESLIWALIEILPGVATQPGGEPIAHFLNPEAGSADIRLYQLAACLGNLIESYQLYRPQILQRWLNGRVLDEEQWQALVWQALIRRTGSFHRFALDRAFKHQLTNTNPTSLKGLPPRLCLFGLSSLAPFFIETLKSLAPYTDLHVFFLNPCQEYWGDLLSKKQQARLSRRKTVESDPWAQMELGLSAEPDFENELLAYFGKLGRDFFDQLVDLESANHLDAFEEPEGKSALLALQSDVLHLQEGHSEIDPNLEEQEPSLQVHSCHSPMREIEVLNDILLDLFEKHPDLTPRDIIVMAPRIDDYSSKIHAVFGRPSSDERYLPYDIADRTPRLSHTLGSAFLRLLTLADTRWEVSEIFSILECVPIMERFDLTESGLDSLRHWIAESGARWARDAASKADHDLPETHANTWQFGLERLLLGYAMPGNEQVAFEGVLPFDHIEGSDVTVLGNFLNLWEQLNAMQEQLGGEHTARRWAQLSRQLVRQFFNEDPDYARELQYLYELFDELENSTEQAGFEGDLTLPVIRTYFEGKLEETRNSGGFFTGGITFCNLLPMRSIPFRVVVLLGMGAREFPRKERQYAFDLMREKPVRGDRSRKQEDRYMFLEALLAARDHFVMLYTGQSVKDNSELSPSVFINQLRDYLERVYHLRPESYTTDHRLQPFSALYFDPENRFRTFAREYLETQPARLEEPITIIDDDTDAAASESIVTIEELIQFLQQPVASYYQHTFGLYKPSNDNETSDVEPVSLEALDTWQLDQWILELMQANVAPHEIGELLRASGRLPHGAHGESELQHLVAGVKRFQERMQQFLSTPEMEPVEVDLAIGDWRLVGKLSGYYEAGLRRVRFGRLREKEHYRLWVEHLVCQSLAELPHKPSAMLGRNDQIVALQDFNTTHAAMHELRQLMDLRRRGLQSPLPLFPKTSMTYTRQRKQGKDFRQSKAQAYKQWKGMGLSSQGERDDYYHHLAFGDNDSPLDRSFDELCEKAIRPILDNEVKNTGA